MIINMIHQNSIDIMPIAKVKAFLPYPILFNVVTDSFGCQTFYSFQSNALAYFG
jgi:hypothetical protein